jgi:choline-glycine betaine transporter
MKAFEPVLAPPEKPDPWWKRIVAYLIICALVPAVAVVLVIAAALVFGLPRAIDWMPVERQDLIVQAVLGGAAGIGLLASIGYCLWAEKAHRERVGRQRD